MPSCVRESAKIRAPVGMTLCYSPGCVTLAQVNRILGLLCIAAAGLQAAEVWTVRVEEPTGLYARDAEAVRVPLAKLGSKRSGFTVLDPQGRELPWQISGNDLLFPATLIPGELPVYRVACCSTASKA